MQILGFSRQWADRLAPRVARAVFETDRRVWQVLRWLTLGIARALPPQRRSILAPLRTTTRSHLRFATLGSDQVFWTTGILPREILGEANTAMAMQIKHLSPIPPHEACFAIGNRSRNILETDDVAVCLVRKTTLKQIDKPVVRAKRADQHVFFLSDTYLGMKGRQLASSRLAQGLALTLFLALSLNSYGHRAAAYYVSEQERLTSVIRELRADVAALDDLSGSYSAVESSSLANYLASPDQADNVVLLSLFLTSRQQEASGFVKGPGHLPADVQVLEMPSQQRREAYRPVRWIGQQSND